MMTQRSELQLSQWSQSNQ